MRHRHAFSLVELLLVILAVAVMLALLLPALSRSKEASKSVVCKGHMQQIGSHTMQYAIDHDELLPGAAPYDESAGEVDDANDATASVDDVGHQSQWYEQLEKNAQLGSSWGGDVYRCISDQSLDPNTFAYLGPDQRNTSYGMNVYLLGLLPGYEKYGSLDEIPLPSQTNFLGEMTLVGDYATADHFHPERWFDDPDGQYKSMIAADRHLATPNWAFLDGHVKGNRRADVYAYGDQSTPDDVKWIHNRFDPELAF